MERGNVSRPYSYETVTMCVFFNKYVIYCRNEKIADTNMPEDHVKQVVKMLNDAYERGQMDPAIEQGFISREEAERQGLIKSECDKNPV